MVILRFPNCNRFVVFPVAFQLESMFIILTATPTECSFFGPIVLDIFVWHNVSISDKPLKRVT